MSFVEMDTVVAAEGCHKALLTFFFHKSSLMLAYLLEDKTQKSVKLAFDKLEKDMSPSLFCKVFSTILTDRGSEFTDPESLECGINNTIRTSIYYCEPLASWQKAGCEKNHEFIRKILPKGSSFDNLTQADVDKLISHINSVPREAMNNQKPYDLAKLLIDRNAFKAFNLRKIPSNRIVLTPDLLKQ